jgi:hypothetical protein
MTIVRHWSAGFSLQLTPNALKPAWAIALIGIEPLTKLV